MKRYNYSTSLYLAETTRGRPVSVFFDPHTPVINNKPPGTLITGAPGSGKTFLALTLTTMSVLLGKITVVLDPKGDFLSLVSLKEEIGNFVAWNLSKGKAGLLDPFYMATDPNDKLSLVIEVIDIFLGGLSGQELSVLSPVVSDVIAGTNPSLQKVVDELRGSEKETAQNLGTQLDLVRKMRFAKLCFAPGNIKRPEVSIERGLTVISLAGIELPKANEPNPTRQQRLASGIMFLLTDFIRRIMMEDDSKTPKTVVIDEAHAVIGSSAGARVVQELALLGRSKFLALLLITQNNSHLDSLDIENTISTRFAFRSDEKEAKSIIKAMQLPTNEGFEDIILDLEDGEALMKDFMNRYATVQISRWRSSWAEAFETNPLEKLKKQRAAANTVPQDSHSS